MRYKLIVAAAAFRRAQPASGLANDARRIAEALRKIEQGDVRQGGVTSEDAWEARGPWSEIAYDALPLAESLPEKFEALEAELAAMTKHRDSILRYLSLGSQDALESEMGWKGRAEAAESQLAERDAEIAKLREAAEDVVSSFDDKGRATAALVCEAIEDLRAALAPRVSRGDP